VARDQPAVGGGLGARLHAGEVGAGAGLAEALAPDLLGGEDVPEVAPLLLLAAVREDGGARPLEADRVDQERRARPVELLRDHALTLQGVALAAVLGGPVEAEVAGVEELALPCAQELELTLGLDLEEGLRKLPARVRGLVRADPGAYLAPEFGDLAGLDLFGCAHAASRAHRRAQGQSDGAAV
jgi:hypothetical protein